MNDWPENIRLTNQEARRRAAEEGLRGKIRDALFLTVVTTISLLFWLGILAPFIRPG